MTKTRDIRVKTDAELVSFITEAQAAVASAYIDLKTKEVKQVRTIRNLKRDIARARTIQSERELERLRALTADNSQDNNGEQS